MARLIDYHVNDHHGGDIHITADLDNEGHLTVTTQPQHQPPISQHADAGAYLGNVMVDTLNINDPHGQALDAANAKLAELCEAVVWLNNQLDEGTVEVSEVRARFGLSDRDQHANDETPAPTPADPSAAATAPARPPRARRGGG